MNQSYKILSISFINHILLIPAIYYGEWWMFCVSFLIWYFIAVTAISSGYHRFWSHKAFKTKNWYKWYSQLIALIANPGPVLTWASTHRMHHLYYDKEKDPHSPSIKGFWIVYFNLWGNNISIDKKFLKDLLKEKSVIFFYNNYFKLIFFIALFFLLIDPLFFLFTFSVPMCFAFHSYGMVNAYTHREKNKIYNSPIVNLFSAGEGYHKNHHEKPWDWKIGKKWWHLDSSAIFIKLIKNENKT